MKLPKLEKDILYIFTDASVTQYYNEYISCSEAIAVTYSKLNGPEIIDRIIQINRCSTNNNGEIKAVYLGILLGVKYKLRFKEINLFSDSKISIYGLREWIKNWVEKSTGDQLIGSTNQPVSNQQEILNCIYQIMVNNLSINLYHQRGHCTNSYDMMTKALYSFKNTNFIDEYISDEFMEFICNMNNIVDKQSRAHLTRYINSDELGSPRPMPQNLVELRYSPFNVNYYLSLVSN